MKIAVVGMAFRLPGDIDDEQSFWRVLKDGLDVVTEVPEERWGKDFYRHPSRKEAGRSITWSAGIVDQTGSFDAGFFGISPREANNLDPQQRLLLELTWEALENGGQMPDKLAGSDCAVYLGISGTDYGLRSIDDLSSVDAYSMTGNTLSIAANRISYAFDFRGPSMAIDTACSSSVVALHQACKSLRTGEASMAVAGGVNMLLHPYPFIGFTKASMLSARGRCRAFDASGDGYVRSEGAGVFFLKPLEQAQADGDPIHAVILASGVNSDGYKNGITIPSAKGQSTLLRATCDQAGITPDDIVYVEAHGTGTAVGDPIETAAIGEAVATRRSSDAPPLYIGSVKTNVGHLESASGMAGLIKTVLCLKHRALPPSLHLETPNPNIDFAGLNLKVVQEFTPLQPMDKPLRMGVNSFGFGGANGNVLLEESPLPKPNTTVKSALTPPLVLSARSAGALRDLAGRYRALIEKEGDYYSVAHAAFHGRQRLSQRLAVYGKSKEEILQRLADFSAGKAGLGTTQEDALAEAGKVAFVYSGNGAQWIGMGRALLAEAGEFRRAVQEVDAQFQPLAGFSILAELLAEESVSRLHLTEVAQPALFAVQVGITRMLASQGLKADATMGHSVGEVAAAWAAGALSLSQAVRVIHERSAAQAATRGTGRMAAVSLSLDEIRAGTERLGLDGRVEIAGINSPKAVTLSGELSDLELLGQSLEPRAVFFKVLDLDYAFHSRKMDVIQDILMEKLDGLAPSQGHSRFISTVTGDELPGDRLDAAYWWRNIREPVQFAAAASRMVQDGVRLFVEISPHAIMQRYLGECLAALDVQGRVIPTLKRNDDGADRIHEAVCRSLLLAGECFDLKRLFPHPANPVTLPAYPWQRERYWYTLTEEGYNLVNRHRSHPLLGYRLKDAEATWENQLDPRLLPYLQDHVVGGAVVFPASGYVEMALAASRAWHGSENHEIESLEIRAPIVFDGEHARAVRFELSPADGAFQIKSRERLSAEEWRLNVVGRLVGEPLAHRPASRFLGRTLADETWSVSAAEHYELARKLGLEYGPAFQAVSACRVDGEGVLVRLQAPAGVSGELAAHVLHPVILDACFQSLFDGFRDEIAGGGKITLLPVGVGRLRHHADGGPVAYCWSYLKKRGPRSAVADFWLLDEAGTTVALLENCRFRGAVLGHMGAHQPATWRYHALAMPRTDTLPPLALPPSADLASHARSVLISQEPRLRRSEYFQRFAPLFEAMVGAFAWEAFQQVAHERNGILAHDWIDTHIPQGSLRRNVLEWMLGLLERDGVILRGDRGWEPSDAETLPAAQDIWLTVLGESPDYLPELLLAGRAGTHLPSILAGVEDAEALARSLRASALNEQCFEASPSYSGMNHAAVAVLERLVSTWPQNRRMRVLDVSEGHGGLTRQLLPLLPHDRVDYLLVGLDEQSVARLEAEFGGLPGVRSVQTDADSLDLADQAGEEPFDVVVLGHVLHRASDLHQTMIQLRKRMAQDGLLLLLERAPDSIANLIFGLDAQWWRPDQTGGRVSSLMSAVQWEGLLSDCGFRDVFSVSDPGADDLDAGAFAVLAKAPAPELNAVPDPAPTGWMVLADAEGPSRSVAEDLAKALGNRGQRVQLVLGGTALSAGQPLGDALILTEISGEAVNHAITAARTALGRCDHVVQMLGMGAGEDDPMAVQDLRCTATLHLVHALEEADLTEKPRLWLVTRGGAVLTDGGEAAVSSFDGHPAQAALWGFGRVLMNEHPDLACTLLDLQCDLDDKAAARLCAELVAPDGEDEIVLTAVGRHVLRMARFEIPMREPKVTQSRLDFTMPGQLKNLHWRPSEQSTLLPDEIEIQPRAVGLNFRDVMYAMGLLSDEAVENGFAGATLGMELSGVVTRVGPNVDEFRVGDAVVAFAPACFASRVVTKAASAAMKPSAWTFEEAATVPTVFFTVYYALHYLARLQPGEKVLIHGAAGGVGIAAVQVARYLGAEIFATAGSDEKRDFVTLLGADHIMNSRTLAYADQVMEITGGQGVDVVLNSLAGEAINRNFRILRPFGRFLELGKRDFYENTKIGLRPFKDNITYYGIDADQLMVERPALASSLFREVMALFEEGALRPLPYRAFPASRVVEAFRYMQASRQIGKVVVTFDDTALPVAEPERVPEALALSPNATYLVTGGIGGFGQRTARWLAEQGARHLVLLSRRGALAPGAAEAKAELEALGAEVHLRACDVTDLSQVSELIHEIQGGMPPLKGVVHAAMVLDDGLIRNLDRERFLRAMAPKIQGGWNLHRATQDLKLDFFVLYSSATTFIGNPGQANYVAANMYLESLAAYRRARGLPGTCVAWGAISDVGYLARNEDIKDALQSRLGGNALASDQALSRLGAMLKAGVSGVAVIDFDWHTLHRFLPATRAPRFDELRRLAGHAGSDTESGEDIRAILAGSTPEEAQEVIRDLLLEEVSAILRLPKDRIDTERSLYDLGMDSLMGVELVLGIEKRFGISLPVMALTEGPTIKRISERLVTSLIHDVGGTDAQSKPLDRLEEMVSGVAAQHAVEATAEDVGQVAAALREHTGAGRKP